MADLILCPHLCLFNEGQDSSLPEVNFISLDKCQMVDFVPKFRREGEISAQTFLTYMIERDL